MLGEIDKKIKLDVFITLVATLVSVLFIISSYLWKEYASQILSILVIVLPTIYIVGNLIIRGIMEKEMEEMRNTYEEGLLEVDEGAEEMKLELERLREENMNLKKSRKLN